MEREHLPSPPAAAADGGAFALLTLRLPPHGAPPEPADGAPAARCCYVLRGTLAVTVGERTVTLRAGEALALAPGLAHSYWNPAAAPVEALLIVAPPAGARPAAHPEEPL